MPVHQLQPYRRDKNLGRAYNEEMKLIPDGHHACLRDIDTLLLTPNTPAIIESYVEKYPHAVLTCFTNRVSPISKKQLIKGSFSEITDISYHINLAFEQEKVDTVTPIRRCISGFLMVVPKTIWSQFPFPETGVCLGVDTEWSRLLIRCGVPILRMDGVYCWHTYRLKNGITDKTHLV